MKIAALCSLLSVALVSAAPGQTPFSQIFGSRYIPNNPQQFAPPRRGLDALHRWNQIAIDATGLDHSPTNVGGAHTFGEQVGPGRSARAMAIVHVSMFEALNAISGQYHGYTKLRAPRLPISQDAAIAQSAHDALVAMYPSQEANFDARLIEDLAAVRNPVERMTGIILGKAATRAVMATRVDDGAEVAEPTVGINYFPSDLPGHWRPDPITQSNAALGAHWGACKPFFLRSGEQFRVPAPPSLTSAEYAAAYNEVKSLGGDGVQTPTTRTAEQTFIGTFWAYDGTPSLCAPPRLYNQITVHIADQTHLNTMQLARLLALVNTALADSGIACWDSKFHWDLWRPVTGIRESDVGFGPTGQGDGNPNTVGDPGFMPLGAPASNLTGPNFTPPFPTYPSGHATFGGALFEVLRRFYGTDRVSFTFVSDEFNGTTRADDGTVRPYIPRTFTSFSQAETENGRSRVYLGIHWSFDATNGITLGRKVGDWVFDHAFQPVAK
ncbi:MAG TPA: vanadium-dependent haloperoxidase [Chthoniobacterales bacterium]